MTEIKKIGVLSIGKVSALMGAVIGLILGLLMTLLGNTIAIFGSLGLTGIGIIWVIGATIGYAVFGFIGGIITAAVYNLVASWVGGIELDLEK